MAIDDDKFEELLTAALYRAAELDDAKMPSDEELEMVVQPSHRFRRRMSALFRNPKKYVRNLRRSVYIRFLRHTAAVFIVLTILFGATMAASPTVRAAVVGLVRSWFPDRTAYVVPANQIHDELTLGYIPEGFELVSQHDYETANFLIYQNMESVAINIIISTGTQEVDNENSIHYERILNGRKSDIYESSQPEYPNTILVYDEPSGVIISVSSEIDVKELMRIVENIE